MKCCFVYTYPAIVCSFQAPALVRILATFLAKQRSATLRASLSSKPEGARESRSCCDQCVFRANLHNTCKPRIDTGMIYVCSFNYARTPNAPNRFSAFIVCSPNKANGGKRKVEGTRTDSVFCNRIHRSTLPL